MKRVSIQQLGKILYELTHDLPPKDLDQMLRSFVVLVHRQQLIKKIEYIIQAFVTHTQKQLGMKQLAIRSARPLSQEQIRTIGSYFGAAVKVEHTIRPELIGGAVIQDETNVYEASVKRQLQRLKRHLTS